MTAAAWTLRSCSAPLKNAAKTPFVSSMKLLISVAFFPHQQQHFHTGKSETRRCKSEEANRHHEPNVAVRSQQGAPDLKCQCRIIKLMILNSKKGKFINSDSNLSLKNFLVEFKLALLTSVDLISFKTLNNVTKIFINILINIWNILFLPLLYIAITTQRSEDVIPFMLWWSEATANRRTEIWDPQTETLLAHRANPLLGFSFQGHGELQTPRSALKTLRPPFSLQQHTWRQLIQLKDHF